MASASFSSPQAKDCLCAVPMNYHPAHLAYFEQELEHFITLLCECNSATHMLRQWMNRPGQSGAADIIAIERLCDHNIPPDAELMGRLQILRPAEIRYRRVWLMYKGRILSDAENWYVPARLSKDMQDQLEQSALPFGTVIAPCAPTRETLSNERLWHHKAPPPLARLPVHILRHNALVRDASGRPISEVRESYTRNILMHSPKDIAKQP